MIGLSFFHYEVNNELERKITTFANNNLLAMLSFVKESYLSEDFIEIILPLHYVREYGVVECENRFYELQELIQSPVCREWIKPLYEYILYKIIHNCIEVEDDYFRENKEILFYFKVPRGLKNKIRSTYNKEMSRDIISELEHINNYIGFCFWDWDFTYNNVERIAKNAIEGKLTINALLAINADDYIDLMPVDLKEEYLKIKNSKKEISLDNCILIALKNAILELERRIPEVVNRSETTLSNDINMAVRSFLAINKIITAREHQMGRALKKLGETDFYFYSISEYGENIDIAILENKVIEKFVDQYQQLLGYLNQNFQCGITISINKTKHSFEAKQYIIDCLCEQLKNINCGDFSFETNLVESHCEHPLVAVSEHKIAENPNVKMKVYHLLLNLYDEPRKCIAEKARKKLKN